jgi:hypothetical protein
MTSLSFLLLLLCFLLGGVLRVGIVGSLQKTIGSGVRMSKVGNTKLSQKTTHLVKPIIPSMHLLPDPGYLLCYPILNAMQCSPPQATPNQTTPSLQNPYMKYIYIPISLKKKRN